MGELTKEDVREAVREAMAEKIELIFGIDCKSAEDRKKMKDNMAFLDALNVAASEAGKRIFWWIAAVMGTGVIALLWPGISKHLEK